MRIVIASKIPFPDGTAPSTYTLNVCRAMVACGHEVTVLGCRRCHKTSYNIKGEYDGIKYINYDASKHRKLITYLYDNYFEYYLMYMLSRIGTFDIVFLFGETVKVAKTLKRYCGRKKIKFGTFNCEWYTEDSFETTISKKYVRGKVDLIPYNAQNADAAILISSLLTNYFEKHGVHSVMIPNIVDMHDEKWNVRKNVICDGKFKLAYAGVPGVGKDELATVIKAIELLPADLQRRMEFHIYGPDKKELLSYLKSKAVEEIPFFVICHGRQKQDEIPARLNECHYTVLIRKPTLRANAGFSTKMVESFAAGVPIIANITGDIDKYLKDGENGIIVADETVEACRDALLRAYKYLENNSVMRRASVKTAQDNFDYRIYKEKMEDFLRFCK